MKQIVVDEELARTIAEATDHVEVRDRQGRPLGYVVPLFTDEDIAIAKQRLASDEPRYTTEQVKDYLRSLEQQ